MTDSQTDPQHSERLLRPLRDPAFRENTVNANRRPGIETLPDEFAASHAIAPHAHACTLMQHAWLRVLSHHSLSPFSLQALRDLTAVSSVPDLELAACAALVAAHEGAKVQDQESIMELQNKLDVSVGAGGGQESIIELQDKLNVCVGVGGWGGRGMPLDPMQPAGAAGENAI